MGRADEDEDAGKEDEVVSERTRRSVDVLLRRPFLEAVVVDDEDIDRRGDEGEDDDADADALGPCTSSLMGNVWALSSRSRSPLRIAMELRSASKLA